MDGQSLLFSDSIILPQGRHYLRNPLWQPANCEPGLLARNTAAVGVPGVAATVSRPRLSLAASAAPPVAPSLPRALDSAVVHTLSRL